MNMHTNTEKKTLRTMIGAHPELRKLAAVCARQRISNFQKHGQLAISNRAAQMPDPGAFLTDLLAKLRAEGAEFDALNTAYEAERLTVMEEGAPLRLAATTRRFEIAKIIGKLDAQVRSSKALHEEELKKYKGVGISDENLAAIKFVYSPEAIAGWQSEIDALKAEAVKLDSFLQSGPFYKRELLQGTSIDTGMDAEQEALAA